MDRDEAIKLLKGGKEGIAEWNRRRRLDEGMPDLSGANLGGADFSGAILGGTELNAAVLRGVVFSLANLTGADLIMADLRNARFIETTLIDANLHKANLSGAEFHAAFLRGAVLTLANLSDANLGYAVLNGTELRGADLSGAKCDDPQTLLMSIFPTFKGLDSVEHRGPSTIGTDTLFRSKGKIPEVFLRGCGVPEHADSLPAQPDRLDESDSVLLQLYQL